ncbi:MAG TPA: FAD binding domain-containing protein [Streptosporangiaceae bacterium]|nr:FAD binding domain-containing protein [Streptosporangiaceae bacterium]
MDEGIGCRLVERARTAPVRPRYREVPVKPPPFSYAAPSTVAGAVGLLAEHADAEPRVLAGGQSLIPLMNFRLAKPGYLIDLRNIAELSGIRLADGVLAIGAMTRMSELERSPEVAAAAPLLAEAVGLVAHTPVRNSATIGGSLAHADPAAELPAVVLATGADLIAVGPAGTRRIPAAEFLRGPFSTALAPDEILTEIRLPSWHGGHAFVEFSRVHANFAVVGVAALVDVDGDRIRRAALALTGVAPAAIRASSAERVLEGAACDAAVVAEAAEAAVDGLSPAGDLHASAATRLALARTYVRRGINLAISRARSRGETPLAGGPGDAGPVLRGGVSRPQPAPEPANHAKPPSRSGREDAKAAACAISLTVNGRRRTAEVEPRRLLVDVLREDLGLTGTHIGCEHGVCGTCTVLLNGASVRSCITLAVQADGADISTVEGLARDGQLHPLQDEFAAKQGLQCGYCTPGMLMRASELLARNPDPTAAQVRAELASNLCRCTGYRFIIEAVLSAAARMRATKEAAP